MPRRSRLAPPTQEQIDQFNAYKAQGVVKAEIKSLMGLSHTQVERLSSQWWEANVKFKKPAGVKKPTPNTPTASPIPRGVPTLPTLPSLLMPLPTIMGM